MYVTYNTGLTTLSFPALNSSSTTFFDIENNPLLTTISMPLVTNIANNFTIGYNDSLTSIDLSSLTETGSGFQIFLCGALTTLDVTAVTSFDPSNFIVCLNGSLSTIFLPTSY